MLNIYIGSRDISCYYTEGLPILLDFYLIQLGLTRKHPLQHMLISLISLHVNAYSSSSVFLPERGKCLSDSFSIVNIYICMVPGDHFHTQRTPSSTNTFALPLDVTVLNINNFSFGENTQTAAMLQRIIIIIIIIIYLFYIALNPCTVLSASQLKGVTLHH